MTPPFVSSDARTDRVMQLRGVRVHNLKGVDLDLPRNELIVFTGVSGSGKSSLAFDTLYAEGQRRYVETFSPYARQFLETLDTPEADRIEGLPPAIAVSQRQGKRSSRSTVGSVTEVHDYLAILYARLGQVNCMHCGLEVRPADTGSVVAAIEGLPEGTRYQIGFPLEIRPDTDRTALAALLREDGFLRVRVGDRVETIEDGPIPDPVGEASVDVIVDRLVRGREDSGRRGDSIETAFDRGLGRCRVIAEEEVRTFYRGWRCAGCGTDHLAPEPRLFRPNSPIGACPSCQGFGRVIDLDLDRIVPDRSKSIEAGAIAPWTTPNYREHLDNLVRVAPTLGIPTDRPFKFLEPEQIRLILEGAPRNGFAGLRRFFDALERKTYKMHIRVFLSRWRGYRPCPDCGGARLRPEALAVKVAGLDIASLSALPIGEARAVIDAFASTEGMARSIARRAIDPVRARLGYLGRIGLDYLTLDRQARTLSGGETRRVALTRALGSGLVNTLYVLDEPSIGLHPSDIDRLVSTLVDLRDRGNAVVVVEHDEAIMRSANRIVDVGPGAGAMGGRILYNGPPDGLANAPESATGAFLARRRRVVPPARRRAPTKEKTLTLRGATGNNLKDLDVSFPLGLICVVTGVSGSGKSTLVDRTLYPALVRRLKGEHEPGEPFRELLGTGSIDDVILVDQSPIGRSARSNPATYVKAFDEIRKTFAATHEAKLRNYGPSRFSFNVPGGRCEACEGNGHQIIDMQFLSDVMVRCPECHGTRYRSETLEVTYRGKSIAEVLDLTVREAFAFFKNRPKVQAKLRPLMGVGLDYLRLGQPASTLSGGEAQRLKLASFLPTSAASAATRSALPSSLLLLDEPTTGLHPSDVLTLIDCLNTLADLGHSLILVEHNPELMLCADWIIDLGPGAGDAGGRIVAEGPPETIAQTDTPTGRVLAAALSIGAHE
ncbi:excinuclease ABC subunit UvrA [Tautonia rosea]|uniref:excinuclease ABC subunit UvrA n=1 Tax=Tautonia rosea TaxID=2728037 RepID=UPI001472CBC1|nr:excinuclease ABC subunit UvrA [Tautonia rosea]